ncbi:hypothetical protein REPUB_Repub14bG0006200 [Reevesia pubescens]
MGREGEDYGKSENVNYVSSKLETFPVWASDVKQCEEKYQVNRELGLLSGEVEKRRQIYGWNDYEGGEMELTAFVEPLVISLILIVNAIVGIWQESNAEKALEALKEIQSEHANVVRDDMRVLSLISSTVRVEQGSLTGESEAVSKTVKVVPENSDIQGKKCMVFAGTTMVNGNCICLATQIGMNTEIGKVYSQIHEASQNEEDTPLKKKLNEFGEVITKELGMNLEKVDLDMLGTCKKVSVSKDDIVILDGNGEVARKIGKAF